MQGIPPMSCQGCPKIWDSDSTVASGSQQYLAALAECAPIAPLASGLFREVILCLTESSDVQHLAPRTQRKMKLSFYHAKNGIRPGDLVALGRSDILPTPSSRRIVLRTRKRDRLASITVSTALAAVTDETQDTQAKLIVTKAGAQCAHANDLGDAVSEW